MVTKSNIQIPLRKFLFEIFQLILTLFLGDVAWTHEAVWSFQSMLDCVCAV